MNPSSLILASESPFRKDLLGKLGFPFIASSPDIDEKSLQQSYQGSVEDLSLFLAEKKALSLEKKWPSSVIIGSDQVLIHQGQALHKPASRDEVRHRLQTLSGDQHVLSTALFLRLPGGRVLRQQVLAKMTMHPLTTLEIENYIDLDLAIGCAGGYKIEAHGMRLFSRIETDDFFSIIGLPILTLNQWLRAEGLCLA